MGRSPVVWCAPAHARSLALGLIGLAAPRIVMFGAVLAGMAACSGDRATGPSSFSLDVSPKALTVLQGSTEFAYITVKRIGSFKGPVQLAASGQPDGPDIFFSSYGGIVYPDSASSTLLVNVGNDIAPGSYVITITANGTGVPEQTATLALTVTAMSSLSASPDSSIAVHVGAAAQTSTITLTRAAPFAGAIALLANAPHGVTATFSPDTIASDRTTSMLSITASDEATNGPFTINVLGSGADAAVKAAKVTGNIVGGRPPFVAVSLNQRHLFVVQGGAPQTDTLSVRFPGKSANVSVVPENVPSGMTVAWKHIATYTQTGFGILTTYVYSVSVSADATIAPGVYTPTIHVQLLGGHWRLLLSVTVSS